MLGMLDVWYTEFWGTSSKAVVPYAQDLALLPSHLQQLQMESNGKSVTADGYPVQWPTSPIVWGAPAPTANTPSSSCCTRERIWSPSTSSE